MKTNEGKADRAIRILIGIILILVAQYFTGKVSIILYILSVISLLTGITGFCGLYALFGINTCKVKEEKQES